MSARRSHDSPRQAHARPTAQTAIRKALAEMVADGRLPEGASAKRIRAAFAHGTLDPTDIALLRRHGAGDAWFEPRRRGEVTRLVEVVAYAALTGRVPGRGERLPMNRRLNAEGRRWWASLISSAVRGGPGSDAARLRRSIEDIADLYAGPR